ncbi:hypothetical protein [Tellurirhabdus rosea]|uniref:hypothetical protein n=1 Tax=Tellurirhabdus rosea TaxID=2674997 RepID=UPI00224DEBF1|nr:hypothetical protein [Tellurirhabdus rosea]
MLSIAKLDRMRMAAGICLVIDGNPLIFFVKETLGLAPGSTIMTAAILAFGLVLMIPTTALHKLYKPNRNATLFGLSFIALSLFYYFFFFAGYERDTTDLIYVAYMLIFLFLLINIPNDIIRDIVPVIILFTLVSNLALVYALQRDPLWTIGQRAFISYETGGPERGGNPHPFAKNALMGVIASLVWAARDKTPTYVKGLCLVNAVFSLGIQILTVARSSYVALALITVLFFFFNVRPAQVKQAFRVLKSPLSLFIMACIAGVAIFFLRRNMMVYDIVIHYAVTNAEKNLENVYALLGMKMNNQVVAFDASSNTRSVNFNYFTQLFFYGDITKVLVGQGYKFMFVDIPIIEALVNHGIPGLVLFGGMQCILLYHAVNAIRLNQHPFATFLGYFYIYVFVLMFTNGRPYDYFIWFPYLLMVRFLGVEKLLPERLLNPNV